MLIRGCVAVGTSVLARRKEAPVQQYGKCGGAEIPQIHYLDLFF